MIPEYINCNSKEITNCNFYIVKECPNSCNYARRLRQGISHNAKTGLERFLHKFKFWEVQKQRLFPPEELGIGAMTEAPKGIMKTLNKLYNGGLTL